MITQARWTVVIVVCVCVLQMGNSRRLYHYTSSASSEGQTVHWEYRSVGAGGQGAGQGMSLLLLFSQFLLLILPVLAYWNESATSFPWNSSLIYCVQKIVKCCRTSGNLITCLTFMWSDIELYASNYVIKVFLWENHAPEYFENLATWGMQTFLAYSWQHLITKEAWVGNCIVAVVSANFSFSFLNLPNFAISIIVITEQLIVLAE